MGSWRHHLKASLLSALSLLLLATTSLQAEEAPNTFPRSYRPEAAPYAKDGFYLGYYFPFVAIMGDLDGQSSATGNEESGYTGNNAVQALLPKADNTIGFGVTTGVRVRGSAFEFNYTASGHSARWQGANMKLWQDIIGLDYKGYYMTDGRLQPHIIIGGCMASLYVKKGIYYWDKYSSSPTIYFDDSQFMGFGINAGGGLAYYLNPRVAVNMSVVYRFIWYTDVDATTESSDSIGIFFDKARSGNGANLNLGVAYTF